MTERKMMMMMERMMMVRMTEAELEEYYPHFPVLFPNCFFGFFVIFGEQVASFSSSDCFLVLSSIFPLS